ncbi:MAG TPA: SCO family protein [Acidobacteriota bacterium]
MKQKIVWLVLLISLTGICAASAWRLLRQERSAVNDLPVFGKVPEFSLIERSGTKVQLKDLKGSVWVADFVFSSCHEACPQMTIRMNALQTSLHSNSKVKLVSFTVDPDHDTPEVLSEYAKQNHVQKNWLLLTGEKGQMRQLITRGFFLPVEPEKDGPTVLHSEKFVLIDQQGQIRGYYDSQAADSQDQILADVQRLLAGQS